MYTQRMITLPKSFTIIWQTWYLPGRRAYALVRGTKSFKGITPSYSLIIYDAARPMSIFREKNVEIWWKEPPNANTSQSESEFGGLHNYGLAIGYQYSGFIWTTIAYGDKNENMGVEAHITRENELVRNGKISGAVHQNRLLLRTVMKKPDFVHFPVNGGISIIAAGM